ncbi:amylo-alpha-1,6-glucosidase [Steroidobacter sp. S1-65]|uniref:Amylo-alpha-1,6-glucosidase n=1 Tax=Steroidobacter gossypii TaxID=2805490 RepID=A0ABS1WXK4_9GAMM|nr:amylo-alpha-1,6-glucosidase [Steroidobacter gossypii]MBM0105712.1 amylo-alpha-1,6-glucosidase [Steroidobacter gossypii]
MMTASAAPAAGAEPVSHFYISAHSSLAELRPRTLKHGDTFALFDPLGDLSTPHGPQGLYHGDMRFLSQLRLTIEDEAPLLLSSTVRSNNAMLDVDLTNADVRRGDTLVLPKDTVHISRSKFLWNGGCYELLSVRNFADAPTRIRIALDFAADFVDVFEVRGFVRHTRGRVSERVSGVGRVRFEYASLDKVPRATEVVFHPAPTLLTERRATFDLELGPKQRRAIVVTVLCRGDDQPLEERFWPAMRAAQRSLRDATHRAAALETSSSSVNEVLCRSMADLCMLVTDTDRGPYPYAGVPWFSTAFGRDGLITAMQMLWLYPSLARGVLRYLAANQAQTVDAVSDAEPGKILHETRQCELARLGEVPFARYYGSIDSTPLFVALAGMYWRTTGDRQTLEQIWPNIKAAFAWMDHYGDPDGDGFLEYRRRSDGGLANQGWKDSNDAVFHADGALAEPAIALCEVQGYAYMARSLGAQMAQALGESALAARLLQQANELKEKFEASFWDETLGTYVLALDGHKRPCRVRSSNAGQVLFTGIASPERAARTAQVLAGRDLFSEWGIRTISSRERRYNPTSYHNGSIWPHDNALIALGLARYGHSRQAARVTAAILDAAMQMDLRRLPELFCGMPRRRDKGPVLYPVACAPQAWAAAAPFALLQACLGLEIDAQQRLVRLNHPCLPDSIDQLRIANLHVGEDRIDMMVRRRGEGVAVNVSSRSGAAEVVVVL